MRQGLASKLMARPSMHELLGRHILRFGDVQIHPVEGKGEYERRWQHSIASSSHVVQRTAHVEEADV